MPRPSVGTCRLNWRMPRTARWASWVMSISTRLREHLWDVPALQNSSAVPRSWPRPVALMDVDLVCAGSDHLLRSRLRAHGTDRVWCGVDRGTDSHHPWTSPSRHHTHSRSHSPSPGTSPNA